MHEELISIVEEFERLWKVAGFAELFSARMAAPLVLDAPADSCDIVLAEHHRLLVGAVRQAQRRGEVPADRDPGELAEALVGFYLSRRLARAPLEDWAREAIATVLYHQIDDD